MKKNMVRRKKTRLLSVKNQAHVVVDTHYICYAPRGIGSISDVVPRPKITSQISKNKEVMIFIQNVQFARELDGYDQYGGWRFNVDAMSYEELVKLSDRIGYVGTSLGEEKVLQRTKKFKHSTISSPLLISKSWRCTICEERYKGGDEIGRLDCGNYHHIECIKQWHLQKNACTLCKSAVALEVGEAGVGLFFNVLELYFMSVNLFPSYSPFSCFITM
ncbi:probable E3 ubiquitin-protein ligase RHG1A [Lycium barbarum]|uniref:probable E3 ubiquitin-protein ligase RHG1A n=1 Tax=Lycium barbarum TaxID=112863 RepID=UPI00293EF08E|nr:probable E3 ubiquitin-protein ligase RHG1A [Lycium barbarum]